MPKIRHNIAKMALTTILLQRNLFIVEQIVQRLNCKINFAIRFEMLIAGLSTNLVNKTATNKMTIMLSKAEIVALTTCEKPRCTTR